MRNLAIETINIGGIFEFPPPIVLYRLLGVLPWLCVPCKSQLT
ncbi:uncharacterized protein METZ01_LOCUS222130, partial [marine metagenome]